jgi:hypothetical protein
MPVITTGVSNSPLVPTAERLAPGRQHGRTARNFTQTHHFRMSDSGSRHDLIAQERTDFVEIVEDLPSDAVDSGKETAVFAGGCFGGVQSVFQRVKGVFATTAGYSGGSAMTETYKQVVTEVTPNPWK